MAKKPRITEPGKTAKLAFIFPDIHFPEHDPVALELALIAHEILKPDISVLLGDVLDCGIFSSHDKRTIKETEAYDYKKLEIDPCNKMLDRIQANTTGLTYYLEGNHEARIERWAVKNGGPSQAIYNLISPFNTLARGRPDFKMVPYSVPTGSRRGFVQIVPNHSRMKTGGLVAVHGWSFAKNAARIHLEKSRSQSIIFGHTHRQQVEVSRDPWTGGLVKAFNPGTLSKLEPLYAVGGSPNDWTHGFALVYIGQNSWTEYVVSIANNACVLPNGTEIKL